MRIRDVIVFLKSAGIPFKADGDVDQELRGYSSIYQYRRGTISWLRKAATLEDDGFCLPESFTCLIIQEGMPKIANAKCQIQVKNPKDVFFDVLEEFWGEEDAAVISPGAMIEDGAVIGRNVSIGPFTHISSKTVIGDGSRIGSNVTIKGKVTIGKGCVIQSGAVIGEDGFAFLREGDALKFMKHYGGVTLEDHVSVGAQTCVCRGAIDDTCLMEYAKVDNLCHIAHNAVIGRRTVVVAGTVVMGSVRIGHDCWVSTSMIRDQRRVKDNCVIGMGAVVVKDVAQGATVAGNPAGPFQRKEKI